MDQIVGVVSVGVTGKNDDDFSDRLSNRYSVMILVVFAIVVTLHSYVGTPITCWTPVHFTGSHESYTNSYCWVLNTYWLPFDEDVPDRHESREVIPYYQWIPFILIGQAIFFYLPSILWHGLNQKGGIDADDLLAAANTLSAMDKVNKLTKFILLVIEIFKTYLISML
mgnify:CR=1 FL=1